jgi:HSP20 family protein
MAYYSLQRPRLSRSRGPFDEFRQEMDALLDRFGAGASGGRRGVFPPANLYEAEDAYVLTAELPGVRPGDVEVSIERSTLTLSGQRRIDHGNGETSAHRLERPSGSFRRAFELPVEVDIDKAEAAHRDGVLMVRLPKAPEHKPRQITVQTR